MTETAPAADEPVLLLAPRDGLPPVVRSDEALAETAAALASGSGSVAVDAERASGYRYSHRAYLVQLRRAGAGSSLIDPIACPDLSSIDEALADTEWVLHAASQDLPCLLEIGMRPRTLFDTELAGRLLDYPKVGLATLVEELLGYRLEKGHASVDWSTRPLPEPWLTYAALDVEVLVELRDVLAQQLVDAGKLDWALEEFSALVTAPPPRPRVDPWRRTSGIHRVRNRRQLGYVRELWLARDRVARRRDVSPGRVLPDHAIVAAAVAAPKSRSELAALPPYETRTARRDLGLWWTAVERASTLVDTGLPEHAAPYDGPPPARSWPERDPHAAGRLAAGRKVLQEIAGTHQLPVENLLAPDTMRRLAWAPPEDLTADTVAAVLRGNGAREWQISLTATALADALTADAS